MGAKYFLCLVIMFHCCQSQTPSLDRAKAVLDRYPIFDGHNDFAWGLRELLYNDLRGFDFNSNLSSIEPWASYKYDQTDIPRLRAGKVGAQFWTAYSECTSAHVDAVQIFMEQIEVIKRLIGDNPADLEFAADSQGVQSAMAAGKIASLIGVESGHAINSNLGILRAMYELGVRYVTLTHNCNTPWADSSKAESGSEIVRSNGLSPFGEKVIQEMNRLGMMVDLSHVSAETMADAISVSVAPVIFSHSNARAVCGHVRNVPTDVLFSLAQNRGIIMINFYSWFLKDDGNSTLSDAVNHINYIRSLIGVDYIGVGSDFCSYEDVTQGLEDSSKYPNLFAALIDDGTFAWTDEELGKIASGNMIRVMQEVETVRDSLVGMAPIQDRIPFNDVYPNEKNCTSHESFLNRP